MPYVVEVIRRVEVTDPEQYFNECCIGGDVVAEQLLPTVKERYSDVQSNQEDWGWFIWFRNGRVRLAVDIFCDDPERGAYRIHLTSRSVKWFLLSSVEDTPDLEELRSLVVGHLERWASGPCRVERLDRDYAPLKDAGRRK